MIEIREFTKDWVPGVLDLNKRIRDAGSQRALFENPTPLWLPKRDSNVWRQYYIAVEDNEIIRGGFCIKRQEFMIRGEKHRIATFQGPVSEAVINPKLGWVSIQMMKHIFKEEPNLFAWGPNKLLTPLLEANGWTFETVPFSLKVIRPNRFLKENRMLGGGKLKGIARDAAVYSGIGAFANHCHQGAVAVLNKSRKGIRVEPSDEFSNWTDRVWDDCQASYDFLAIRDQNSMNAVLGGEWPKNAKLKVLENDEVIGWVAVMDHQFVNDRRFGSMRVGTLVDFFGRPEDAYKIIGGVSDYLAREGVDIICSNQSSDHWTLAMKGNGYITFRDRRNLAISKKLRVLMEPFEETREKIHMTLVDGEGPIGFGPAPRAGRRSMDLVDITMGKNI